MARGTTLIRTIFLVQESTTNKKTISPVKGRNGRDTTLILERPFFLFIQVRELDPIP